MKNCWCCLTNSLKISQYSVYIVSQRKAANLYIREAETSRCLVLLLSLQYLFTTFLVSWTSLPPVVLLQLSKALVRTPHRKLLNDLHNCHDVDKFQTMTQCQHCFASFRLALNLALNFIVLTFNNSGACFFSFSIFHSFSQGLREDGGAVHEHLQSDPELTVSTV